MFLRFSLLIISIALISCVKLKTEIVQVAPTVHFTIGDVSINGQSVKIGQEIKDGDIVETGEQSYLEAWFGKQSAFRVREDSRVVFNISDQVTPEVQKGKIMSILEKKSNYQVRTPAAVAAVRGTIFFVSVLSNEQTYFCACNGSVAIEDDQHKELTLLSSSHHQPGICAEEDGELTIQDAQMADHDDLEIFNFMYRMDQAIKN